MRTAGRFIAFILVFCASVVRSQDVRVEAVLDTGKLRIGEQVKVDLYLNYDSRLKDISVTWPEITDTLGHKVEVISVGPIDTTLPAQSNSQRIFQHQQITVSVYDSGYYAVPPLRFVVNGDTAHPLYTRPLLLEVHTVPTDTSAAKVKDIKPPLEEPFNWKWYLNYIYGGIILLAVIAAIILLTIYFSRKKKLVVAEPEKPRIPPHVLALQSLEKISSEKIWKEGHVKQYYSSISDTVRLYIENRFGIKALESTTDEIMLSFRSQVIDPQSKEKLQQLLMLSDLVKFAKMTPVEMEHDLTLANAFAFVRGTMREEEVPPVQGDAPTPAS